MAPSQCRSIEWPSPQRDIVLAVAFPKGHEVELASRSQPQVFGTNLVEPVKLAGHAAFRAFNALAAQHADFLVRSDSSRKLVGFHRLPADFLSLLDEALASDNRTLSSNRGSGAFIFPLLA